MIRLIIREGGANRRQRRAAWRPGRATVAPINRLRELASGILHLSVPREMGRGGHERTVGKDNRCHSQPRCNTSATA